MCLHYNPAFQRLMIIHPPDRPVKNCQAKWFTCGDHIKLPSGIFAPTAFLHAKEPNKTVEIRTKQGDVLIFNYHELVYFQSKN